MTLATNASDPLRPIRRAADAEYNAAVFLRRLGFDDAAPTPDGPDGGVDVRGVGILAQVKAETAPVGALVVQALFGCASAERASGAFFSLSGYTPRASAWADMAGLALFEFDLLGDAIPVNNAAVQLSVVNEYPDQLSAEQSLPGTLRSRWAELENLWGLDRQPSDSRLVVGVADRFEEVELWHKALAFEIAYQAAQPVRLVAGNECRTAGDMASILSSLAEGEVLAINRWEEVAAPAKTMTLEAARYRKVDVVIGKGVTATRIPLELPPFSLVVTVPRGWASVDPSRRTQFHPGVAIRLPMVRSFVQQYSV